MYTIPLFPLNMVVFPFEQVPLHIFEPRYKKMIDESLKNNTPFGIVSKNNGSVDSVGCSLKVTKIIKHYESGEYDLIATGDKCFQVIERSKVNDLWVGNIEYMKTPEIEDKNILKSEALEWSITRGARSGRVAWQFIQDLAGKNKIKIY